MSFTFPLVSPVRRMLGLPFLLLSAFLFLAFLDVLVGQTRQPLEFDVASVKPTRGGSLGFTGGFCQGGDTVVSVSTPPGVGGSPSSGIVAPNTCQFRHTTLREIIAAAYDLPRSDFKRLVVGGPSWMDSDLWDIQAKADGARTQTELHQMLQNLLKDRFGLRLVSEIRQLDGYSLVFAKGGHKLREVTPSTPGGIMLKASGTLQGSAAPLTKLIFALTVLTGETIVDRTGLSGYYDFSMTWVPSSDEMPRLPRRAVIADPPESNVYPSSGPSLITALTEQLGLTLARQKTPTEVKVVGAVSRATPN